MNWLRDQGIDGAVVFRVPIDPAADWAATECEICVQATSRHQLGVARPALQVAVVGPAESPAVLCLLDTGSIHNRFAP